MATFRPYVCKSIHHCTELLVPRTMNKSTKYFTHLANGRVGWWRCSWVNRPIMLLRLGGGGLRMAVGVDGALSYPSFSYMYVLSNSIISPSNHWLLSCPANRYRISNEFGSNRNDLYNIKNRVILIKLDIWGGKLCGVAQPNSLQPITAVAHTMAHPYSLWRISWRNKSIQKSNNACSTGPISNGVEYSPLSAGSD